MHSRGILAASIWSYYVVYSHLRAYSQILSSYTLLLASIVVQLASNGHRRQAVIVKTVVICGTILLLDITTFIVYRRLQTIIHIYYTSIHTVSLLFIIRWCEHRFRQNAYKTYHEILQVDTVGQQQVMRS